MPQASGTGGFRHIPSSQVSAGTQWAHRIPFADVDDTIRHQAQRSTDWRVEMWILAMTTDRYISNK